MISIIASITTDWKLAHPVSLCGHFLIHSSIHFWNNTGSMSKLVNNNSAVRVFVSKGPQLIGGLDSAPLTFWACYFWKIWFRHGSVKQFKDSFTTRNLENLLPNRHRCIQNIFSTVGFLFAPEPQKCSFKNILKEKSCATVNIINDYQNHTEI